MKRLVVVSNRVEMPDAGDDGSRGGLSVAVLALLRDRGGLWFGWSGEVGGAKAAEPQLLQAGPVTYATADLSARDYDEYYAGFANSVLWPLFHYRLDLTDFTRRDMAGYERVNALFAKRLAPLLKSDDLIWVHDYHFIPLCRYLRQAGCKQRTGFFLHIPWPSTQVLLALPNHRSLVRALLDYDLVGLQTEGDRASFFDYIENEAGGRVDDDGTVEAYGARALIKAFPISIDTARIPRTAAAAVRGSKAMRLKASVRNRRLIIGVDRLDYTKGLLERLEAYDYFLHTYAEQQGKVVFLQIAQPSRTDVDDYANIRQEVQSAAGQLNGRFAEFDWTPCRYLNRGIERNTLMGFLRLSDIGLITPLRDGMNLVAKEFVAAQSEQDPGVLVLSRFAGAAAELDAALVVNPYDIEGVGEAMLRGLAMTLDERKERWSSMMSRLRRWDIYAWRDAFLEVLTAAPTTQSLAVADARPAANRAAPVN